MQKCEELNVTTYVSPKESSATASSQVFPMDNFTYSPKYDHYTCPNNKILASNGTIYQRKSKKPGASSVGFKHYKTKDCKNCPIKSLCTTSPNGRLIQRQLNQDSITRNNRRVHRKPEYYRQRQQIIENERMSPSM